MERRAFLASVDPANREACDVAFKAGVLTGVLVGLIIALLIL